MRKGARLAVLAGLALALSVAAFAGDPAEGTKGPHWERGAPDFEWGSYPPPGVKTGALGKKPRDGDAWEQTSIEGRSSRWKIVSMGSSHISYSVEQHLNAGDWTPVDISWTEPPKVMIPGQTVQFKMTVSSDLRDGFIHDYLGAPNFANPSAHKRLVYVRNGGTPLPPNAGPAAFGSGSGTAIPYKVPDLKEAGGDASTAEIGFFNGDNRVFVWFRYHWVSGPSGISATPPGSPAPPRGTAADPFSGRWTGTWHNTLKASGQSTLNLSVKGNSISGDWGDLAIQNARRNGNQLDWECDDGAHKRHYWIQFQVLGPGKGRLRYRVKGVNEQYEGWVDDYALGGTDARR